MFLKILINYILGYVNIEVEGFYLERFINICISKRIFLWNINREKSSIMSVNIGIQDVKNIKEILRKSGCKFRIKQKKGIPFIFNRYKKRKVFLIIFCVVLIAMYTLSNFIWNIEIVGLERIEEKDVYQILGNNGLKIGSIKKNIDTKEIVNDIRMKREDIAWVGINIKGTNAKVEIVESTPKPEIINEDEYCNIVSNKKGVITKINALNGTAQVKVRGFCIRRDCFNCWLDGRKIYRKKICTFNRGNRSKSMVYQNHKKVIKGSKEKCNREYRKEI